VIQGREKLKEYFSLNEVREVSEYVGCKIDYNKEAGYLQLTKLVLIQSFKDEFELPDTKYKTPAAPQETRVVGPVLKETLHRQYLKGVGKLILLAKYSRPHILISVRELTKFVSKSSLAKYKAMLRVMKFCRDTRKDGIMVHLNEKWDGVNRHYLF